MHVKRISFKEGWLDFWARIYGFDSMFPRTLRDLTLRPGIAAKRYIEGNRAMYYGPVGYFFLMVTLWFLVASILGVDIYELMTNRGQDVTGMPAPTGRMAEFQKKLIQTVIDNFKLFFFAMIIFQSLWLRAFFRRSGYNVLEHSVMVFFVMGHIYWISILDLFTGELFGFNIPGVVMIVINVGFFAFACLNLYPAKYRVDKSEAFVRGVLTWVVSYITFAIFIMIFSIILIFADPETYKLLAPENKPG